jgi:hypothetical protein
MVALLIIVPWLNPVLQIPVAEVVVQLAQRAQAAPVS